MNNEEQETIYEWEDFMECLEYLEFPLQSIMDFEEYYQNLNKPIVNFEEFIKFNDMRKEE